MTLIKSVLNSLPIYYLSLFKIPEGVAKEIDMIQSRLLGVAVKQMTTAFGKM